MSNHKIPKFLQAFAALFIDLELKLLEFRFFRENPDLRWAVVGAASFHFIWLFLISCGLIAGLISPYDLSVWVPHGFVASGLAALWTFFLWHYEGNNF